MSLLNTNQRIPDGYATIRRSGVLRSKNSHPSVIKRSKSVPKTNTSDLSTISTAESEHENNFILTQLDSITNENNNNDDYFHSPSSSKQVTMLYGDDDDEEFNNKCVNLNTLNEQNESISCYNYSLPPLKSPQYINKLNTFRSKAHKKQDINLYVRPKSPPHEGIVEPQSLPPEPLYQNITISPIYANFSSFRIPAPPPPPRDYQNLNKLKTFHSLYDESVKRKPPIKSATLQPNRTFHCSSNTNDYNNIYAEPIPLAHSTNKGSSEFSDVSSEGFSSKLGRRSASDIVSLDFAMTKPRYATYGYQKKTEDKHLIAGKSTGSLNEAQLDYFDVFNCKVGCQNSLRTKPKVPWYELAIKKDNRQSCPPLYEGEVFYITFNY